MTLNAEKVSFLAERELQRISQPELVSLIQQLRVEPRCELREWDYGELGEAYPCWIVLEHKDSNTGVAYCEQGFGPATPWGILFLSGPHMSIGADFSWFVSLEDAVRECSAWEGPNPPGYEVQ